MKINVFLLLTLFIFSFAAISHSQSIKSFNTCHDLNRYYIKRVINLVGPFGLTSSNVYTPTREPTDANIPGTAGGPAGLKIKCPFREPRLVEFSNITSGIDELEDSDDSNEQVAGTDFSTTNVQIKGVDEPDIIKTDGKRVFTISGDIFSTVEVLKDGKSGRRTGKIKLPTNAYDFEMLIEGDYILLIGLDYTYRRPIFQRYLNDPSSGEESTVIYQLYVGGDKPRLLQTLHLEGRYIKSREVDGIARLVLRFNPLSSIWLYYPSGKIKRKQTKKWNRQIIKYSNPGNWLPTYRLRNRRKELQIGTYVKCGKTFFSGDVFSGYNLLTVVTLPVNASILTPGSTSTVMSDADKVFANKQSMYITTSEFHYGDLSDSNSRWGENYRTSIHKFSLSNSGAKYTASGVITGSIINQFAMHEYKDIFFVATTDGATWWTDRDLSASKVTAFETNLKKKRLVRIGQVGNLGVGERIYSVRYIRDTAYVVTFREVDPLYIVDLSNTRKLRVTGELKIPGFSSYLHPVAPGRILGVGREATPTGVTTGAKVSLFDVSDKSNPKEIAVWSLKGSYTEANWDHRAFLYWRKERVAVMPVDVYINNQDFTGAIILDITDESITERGRISHFSESGGFRPSIRRNAIIGRTNLWSMSSEFLQVNNINKLEKVQSKVTIT